MGPPSKDEAFVDGPLGLGRLPPQAQVLQRVVEMLVDLLRFLTGLEVGEVFSDLLDELVQHLNRDLQEYVRGHDPARTTKSRR